jgi:iron complex transport system ATP-binding protein
MTSLVESAGLAFSYGQRPVLQGVDFRLAAGELVALVGPNGAGKSTLLHALLGILTPDAGEVLIAGRPRRELARRDIARQVAFVPQDAPADFAFTVRELVAMGRTPHLGRFQPERRADVEAIERALEATGLRSFEDRMVSELSGGERQRVHLARAVAQETPALLLDEPTANLDLEHQLEVLGLVQGLVRGGKGAVVALHDLSLAARYADRVVVLAEGRVVLSGPPRSVITEDALARWFHIKARVFTVSPTRSLSPSKEAPTLETDDDILVLVPESRTK